MSLRGRPYSRAGRFLSLFLLPATLLLVGELGTTHARFADARVTAASIRAGGASVPTTPGQVHLRLYVGDKSVNCPLFQVTNPSGWSMTVTVATSGWIPDRNGAIFVAAEPLPPDYAGWPQASSATIGPYQSALVYFSTAAAAGPSGPIAGQVVVTAAPGGHQHQVTLTGEVVKPANASEHHRTVPDACIESTPRPKEAPVGEGAAGGFGDEEPLDGADDADDADVVEKGADDPGGSEGLAETDGIESPNEPADPADPVDLADPADPADPVDPVGPTEPERTGDQVDMKDGRPGDGEEDKE